MAIPSSQNRPRPAGGATARPAPTPAAAPRPQILRPPPSVTPPVPDARALADRARRNVTALAAELAAARARIAALEAEVAALKPPPPPPTLTPTITLRYFTGWRDAYAHYATDGSPAWTPSPGVQLAEAAGGGWKELVVPASRLEFVLNDGGSGGSASGRRWDTPDPTAPRGVNYVIDAPGVWRLSGGKLEKVE